MAMLEAVEPLTLALLNQATLAWVEYDYHRTMHRELGCTPLERYLEGPDVGRPCPDSDTLRRAFRIELTRTQRLSDGTVSLDAHRFEVPTRFRHLKQLCLRYARCDLSNIDLIDPRTGTRLCPLYPLDKSANASGERRRRSAAPLADPTSPPAGGGQIAPLLKKLLAEFAATGLPPPYLPEQDPSP